MTDAFTDSPAAQWRAKLLDAAIGLAPFEGWTAAAFRQAATEAGLTNGQADVAAPRGALDLIDAFADRADRAMEAALAAPEAQGMKVREKATLAIRARLESLEGQKEAVRRAALALASPLYAPDAPRIAWRTADRAWRAMGDTSTDFNWYTKRAILSAVHGATLAYWLQDDTLDSAPTWAFLDRRIAGIMRFEKAKAQVKGLAARLPDPLGVLSLARGLRGGRS